MFFDDHRKHGLRHNPFKALVAPRPIAWVSSVSAAGVANLAPFSYFNACADRPPTVMFAPNNPRPNGDGKDTLRNIEQTNEFVVNLAGYDLREAMNLTSAHVDPSVDEFVLAGLTPAPSVHVKAPRVEEAPDLRPCDPFAAGSDGRRRYGGGHGPRPHRAGRPAAHHLQRTGHELRGALHRWAQRARRKIGAGARDRLRAEVRRALDEDGCESVVLGCAGMVDMARALSEELGAPVVEGVTAAVKIVEGLATLGVTTSKRGGYAPPRPKTYTGAFSRYAPGARLSRSAARHRASR